MASSQPEYWNLVPEPAPGHYYEYICYQEEIYITVDDCSGHGWNMFWDPWYPLYYDPECSALASEGGCTVHPSYLASMSRGQDCVPSVNYPGKFDVINKQEIYCQRACTSIPVPFPEKNPEYSYSDPWHEYQDDALDREISCMQANGSIETSLDSDCHNYYRCKTKNTISCIECFSISGYASACGDFVEYTLTYINNNQDNCGENVITDRPINISYVGSSINVSGPNVVMASTLHPVTFSVYVSYMNCWSGNVVASIEWVDGVNTEKGTLCITSVSSSIRCECDETKPIPPGGGGGGGGAPPYTEPELPNNCCDYMPKDFIAWSDGWNLRQLVPPNER